MKYHIPIFRSLEDEGEREVPVHRGATVLAAIFWTLIVLSTGVYATWYVRNHRGAVLAAVPLGTGAYSSDDYIAAIAKKILLPKDRIAPRVAIVTDPVLLTEEQEFYRGAEAGDVLVVFEESRRAIIYSPRRDIIVNVGPVVPKGISLNDVHPSKLEGDMSAE
jgi:hypothetical protein